jgi:hypothetical protein
MKETYNLWKSLRAILWVALPVIISAAIGELSKVSGGAATVLIAGSAIAVLKFLLDYITHPKA